MQGNQIYNVTVIFTFGSYSHNTVVNHAIANSVHYDYKQNRTNMTSVSVSSKKVSVTTNTCTHNQLSSKPKEQNKRQKGSFIKL